LQTLEEKSPYPLFLRGNVFEVDNDGELISLLSPRFHPENYESNLAHVLELFSQARAGLDTCGVALTVEELCPGGIDPSWGVQMAKAFEAAGADFIVASGGTKDLPALKWRRPTKLRSNETEFEETFPWMASAAWLVGRVAIPVWAKGEWKDDARAQQVAKELGLAGIINQELSPNP
jgi:hypothetical protein